jgi:hypothetical protein
MLWTREIKNVIGKHESSNRVGARRRLLGFLCVACIAFGFASAASGNASYDGRWWLSINDHQRKNFLEGYLACHSVLTTDDGMQFKESNRAYYMRLTTYFQAHPDSLRQSVEAVLWKVAGPRFARPTKELPNGEGAGEKWGVLDGEYWHLDSDQGRLGFVQGFLECYTKRTKQEQGTFSKPNAWYVGEISRWYGIKPENASAMDPNRESTKIPEVLFRFRD